MKNHQVPIAITIVIAALAMLPSPRAEAGLPLLICPGEVSLTFTPGLTNDPNPSQVTELTAEANYGPCLTPLNLSGTNSAAGPVFFTCTDLISQSFPGVVYVWSNGLTSTVNFTTNYDVTANGEIQVVSKGTVVAGLGVGLPATLSTTFLTADLLACESPQGLQSIDGIAVLVFGL